MPGRIVVLFAIVTLLTVGGARLLAAWLKFRGRRVITCPENHRPAGVTVDSRHAAWTGVAHIPSLRLSECSRWPERAGCGQECLSQIEASPEGCLVHQILLDWYEGKACTACGQPIGKIVPGGCQPALLMADGISLEWRQVAAELLPETLTVAQPICFACHMAQTMVREHPDVVVDRHLPESRGSLR